jgi:breakpoint cluster region protein
MNEEGLYRISGQSVAVDELKEDFEKNLSAVVSHKLKTADINVLTSVVKLFFRSLPDPLFTEALYANFAEGIGLADPDAKESCLLALVRRLPDPNFHTIIYLVDHLIRVSQLESRNKMGLRNLATVFGPTLLRPANRHSQPKTMEQLFFLAAHEATVQTTVLYQLLMMRSSGVQFDPASSVSVTSF